MEIDALMNVNDVAQVLKISRQQVYRLIQIGKIPSVRIEKSVRVRNEDLEEFIEKSWTGWLPSDQE